MPVAGLPIPQVVGVNDVAERPLLPSFLYLPAAKEFPQGGLDLPWKSPPDRVVGVFARDHGAKVPGRLVSSAKSWLSHSGVDRRAAILPWTAADDVPRVSPVAASSAYLEHLRDAWNARIAGKAAAEVRLRRLADAASDAEQSLRLGDPTPRRLYAAARTFAQASGVAAAEFEARGRDADLRKATSYEARARTLLARAFELTPAPDRAAFWRDIVRSDTAFEDLRRRGRLTLPAAAPDQH